MLKVDATTIKAAILKTPKLKVKNEHVQVVSADEIRVLPYDTTPDNLYFCMQVLKKKLPSVIVTGISSIIRSVVNAVEDKETKTKKYQIILLGYGLKQILTMSEINPEKTDTNNIMECCEVLGIEAARRKIGKEIDRIMKDYDIRVDERHIGLLADIMTYKGRVLGINRFGIAKMKNSTLGLASFEKTTDILYDAALFGAQEDTKGVSDAIILGDAMRIGTGSFKIMYDQSKHITKKSRRTSELHSKVKKLDEIMNTVKLDTIYEEL
jgi:DNA-directed RNA polymerase III subunit RPC1